MKRTGYIVRAALLGLAVTGLVGCASSRSGTTFSRSEALQAQRTFEGTVESVQEGRIEGTQSPIGAVAGGVLGGFAGNTVGGGTGRRLATVGGALAGAAVGAMAEEGLTSRRAVSVTVKLDDGRLLTIVQEAGAPLAPGQRVRVLETQDGKMRVQ